MLFNERSTSTRLRLAWLGSHEQMETHRPCLALPLKARRFLARLQILHCWQLPKGRKLRKACTIKVAYDVM